MIGSQYVVLYITPLVITFHRRGDSVGMKKEKNKGKRAEQGTGSREKPKQGKGRRGKKKTCIMQS